MADQESTFWRLDGRLGWQTSERHDLAIGGLNGLRLDAAQINGRAVGPYSLDWPDGSLGAALLPKGMAIGADGSFFLVSPEEGLIKRYDAHQKTFAPLPSIGPRKDPDSGQAVTDGRSLAHPVGLALAAGLLYVVDDIERRVQVFSAAPPYLLVYLWSLPGWQPVDVAAWGGNVYVLDAATQKRRDKMADDKKSVDRMQEEEVGRVYRQPAGSDHLQLFFHPLGPGRWTRLGVDRDGNLNLLDETTPRVVRYDRRGKRLVEPDLLDAGDIRDNFDPPPLRLRYRMLNDGPWSGRFRLPQSLAGNNSPDLPVFDRLGRPAEIAADDPLGPYLYSRAGSWTSAPLDSGIYRCQWHRIELELARPLPPGSRVIVRTFSSDEPPDMLAPDALWAEGGSFLGQLQKGQPDPQGSLLDALVQSREGQYLAVRVELEGDGYTTPEIRALRVHYPRVSYLNYLPAVYQSDDQSRWFLERFLSIFQTEWDGLDAQIEGVTALFDPLAVSAGWLEQLASWVGLPLEGTWNLEQKRAMLKAVPQIYSRRGTSEGLKRYLQVYLGNISGVEVEKQPDLPLLLEGFRERQRVILAAKQGANLNQGALLWGPAQVGRLQLDVYATEGEVKLVSTGDPERDLFLEYAHRFRVYVPGAWIRTKQDEAMLRRAIEAEKPAQAAYDLCLVEARFQVGVQSLVGINTIIGQLPAARLACVEQEKNAPPNQAPRGRLGYDTVLSGAAQPAGSIFQISPGSSLP